MKDRRLVIYDEHATFADSNGQASYKAILDIPSKLVNKENCACGRALPVPWAFICVSSVFIRGSAFALIVQASEMLAQVGEFGFAQYGFQAGKYLILFEPHVVVQ